MHNTYPICKRDQTQNCFVFFIKLFVHGSCSLDLTKRKGWYIYIGEKMGFDQLKFSNSNANMCHCLPYNVTRLGFELASIFLHIRITCCPHLLVMFPYTLARWVHFVTSNINLQSTLLKDKSFKHEKLEFGSHYIGFQQ